MTLFDLIAMPLRTPRAPPALRAALLAAAVAATAATTTVAPRAQEFPAHPVRIIVPLAAGSAVDTLARVPAQKLAERWGQQVLVDNRVGANGIIGTEAAAKAQPDGYTIVLTNDAALATNPALYPKLPYDPLHDFVPITLAASIPMILVVHPSLPVRSVKELIDYAREHPGEIHYNDALGGMCVDWAVIH